MTTGDDRIAAALFRVELTIRGDRENAVQLRLYRPADADVCTGPRAAMLTATPAVSWKAGPP